MLIIGLVCVCVFARVRVRACIVEQRVGIPNAERQLGFLHSRGEPIQRSAELVGGNPSYPNLIQENVYPILIQDDFSTCMRNRSKEVQSLLDITRLQCPVEIAVSNLIQSNLI